MAGRPIKPTPDTPAERDEKATELRVEREEEAEILRIERVALAKIIAEETKKFRWEVRLYWAAIAVILFINT